MSQIVKPESWGKPCASENWLKVSAYNVLNRAELRRQLPSINDRIVNAFLTKLEAKAILLANVPEEFHYERDPDDEIYINLAIAANASYLVSRDKDLLDLLTTSTEIARQFHSRCGKVED